MHLEAGDDLLAFLVAQAPEQYRETTLTNVRRNLVIVAYARRRRLALPTTHSVGK